LVKAQIGNEVSDIWIVKKKKWKCWSILWSKIIKSLE